VDTLDPLEWRGSVLQFGAKETRKALDALEPLGRRDQGEGSDVRNFAEICESNVLADR